jgi:hypothetical protein
MTSEALDFTIFCPLTQQEPILMDWLSLYQSGLIDLVEARGVETQSEVNVS